MTTTELIGLLKGVENGGITGKPREISFYIDGCGYLFGPNIEIYSTGDGICGAELSLHIFGGKFYEESEGEEE